MTYTKGQKLTVSVTRFGEDVGLNGLKAEVAKTDTVKVKLLEGAIGGRKTTDEAVQRVEAGRQREVNLFGGRIVVLAWNTSSDSRRSSNGTWPRRSFATSRSPTL